MEALGIVSSVLGILEVAARVAASAARLVRGMRGARRDGIQVRGDMSGLEAAIGMIAGALDHHHDRPGGYNHSREGLRRPARTGHPPLRRRWAWGGPAGPL